MTAQVQTPRQGAAILRTTSQAMRSRRPEWGIAMQDGMIRVLLADDHTVVRTGLKAVLGSAKDMTVVGEAATGTQAAAIVSRCDPDVVVMDLDMPDGNGLEATKAIVARGPRPRVLILTMHTEEEHLLPVLQAGAGRLPGQERCRP